MYTFSTVKTQKKLPQLNKEENLFFCGSYFAYGFHEDAVASSYRLAERLSKK